MKELAIVFLLLLSTSIYREIRNESSKQLTRFEYELQMAECFNYNERVHGEEVVNQHSNEVFQSCSSQILQR